MPSDDSAPNFVRLTGLIGGPVLAALIAWLASGQLDRDGTIVTGLLVLMACWWLTLAVDLAVTALLPVLLLPLLGVGSFETNAKPYANDIIFLFGGGFVLSAGLERSGLSRVFALFVLRLAGRSSTAAVGGLMLVTASISGFVSNSATTAAMLPIAIAAMHGVPESNAEGRRRFTGAAVLGIAYAASIGGALTLIGSPPNAIAAQYVQTETGRSLTFARWMLYGLPVTAILLPAAWLLLTRVMYPLKGVMLAEPVPPPEAARVPGRRATFIIFMLTVLAWLSRPLWQSALPALGDAGIALGGALLLMLVPRSLSPYEPLVRWSDLRSLPWGVLILFGGGLSLAGAIDRTGVAAALGHATGPLHAAPLLLLLLVLVAVACFASEIASNTALAGVAMPIVGAIALSTGQPLEHLAIATALGASFAFMLPVGTPPNAMAFATGMVRPAEMAKAGLLLNFVAIAVIVLVVYFAS